MSKYHLLGEYGDDHGITGRRLARSMGVQQQCSHIRLTTRLMVKIPYDNALSIVLDAERAR